MTHERKLKRYGNIFRTECTCGWVSQSFGRLADADGAHADHSNRVGADRSPGAREYIGQDEAHDVALTTPDRIQAELVRLREALRRIATPPFQWDSPETRDTSEVRLRCRIARAALNEEGE